MRSAAALGPHPAAEPPEGAARRGGSGSGSGSGSTGGTGIIITDGGGTVEPVDAGCASHTEAAEDSAGAPGHLDGSIRSMVGADVMEDLQPVKWDPLSSRTEGLLHRSDVLGALGFDDHVPAEPSLSCPGVPAHHRMRSGGLLHGERRGDRASEPCIRRPRSTTRHHPTASARRPTLRSREPSTMRRPRRRRLRAEVRHPDGHRRGALHQCDDQTVNTIAAASAEAAAVAAEIPTYVIGVGDSLDNLNAIAEGGGTAPAILVTIDDPAKTQAEIRQTAINQIRGKEIACNIQPSATTCGPDVRSRQGQRELHALHRIPEVLTYDQSLRGGRLALRRRGITDRDRALRNHLRRGDCRSSFQELNIILGCATEVPK